MHELTKHIARILDGQVIMAGLGTFGGFPRRPLLTYPTALYFYDKVLVLHQEVDLIWGRRRRGVILLVAYTTTNACLTILLIAGVSTPYTLSCTVRSAILGLSKPYVKTSLALCPIINILR